MESIFRSGDDPIRCDEADDAALLSAATQVGRHVAAGVAHDLNSALQCLGDALFAIAEDAESIVESQSGEGTPEDKYEAATAAAHRLRESLQAADGVYMRLAATTRAVSHLVPALAEDRRPIDLRNELFDLVAFTAHEWRHRLEVSVAVDPAMRTFACDWWVARFAALRMILIGLEAQTAHGQRANRKLPRLRLMGSESDGCVELRVVCEHGGEQPDDAPWPLAQALGSDPTLDLCAARLGGHVRSVPYAHGIFGIAFQFPVRMADPVEQLAFG